MTDDLTPIINRLSPRDDGEPAVKYRKGIVAGVGSGVIDVLLSGVVVPDVAIHGTASVSDEVHLLVWRGDLLAIGECGGSGGGCGSCNLGDLLNVDTSGEAQGDMLYYDGSNWVLVGGTKATGNVPTIQGSGAVAWQPPSSGGGVGYGRPSGTYHLPGMPIVDVGTSAAGINTIVYYPIIVQETITVASLDGEVTGGAGAGRAARWGLYETGVDWTPGDLIFEGEVSAASTGARTVAAPGGGVTLPPGRYLTARVVNNATPVFRTFQQNPLWFITGAAGNAGRISGFTVAFSYAALPDPGPAWTGFATGLVVSHFGLGLT